MPKTETLGQRLAQLRREKAADEHRDIDQAEIAKAAGLGAKNQSYISKYERDAVRPRDETLVALAKYYNVSVGWLRFGEGERRPKPSVVTPESLGLDPATDHRLTPEEAARAEAIVAEKARAKLQRPARKVSGGKKK